MISQVGPVILWKTLSKAGITGGHREKVSRSHEFYLVICA